MANSKWRNEDVKLHRRARGDCRGDRPLEVRRDDAKAFAEAELFVENAPFGAIGHARADDVEPVALLAFADDDLAALACLDGYEGGDGTGMKTVLTSFSRFGRLPELEEEQHWKL